MVTRNANETRCFTFLPCPCREPMQRAHTEPLLPSGKVCARARRALIGLNGPHQPHPSVQEPI